MQKKKPWNQLLPNNDDFLLFQKKSLFWFAALNVFVFVRDY